MEIKLVYGSKQRGNKVPFVREINRKAAFALAFLALASVLPSAGCQTLDAIGDTPQVAATEADGAGTVSKQSYNLLFGPEDHLSMLMDQGNFADADRLFAEQRTHFMSKGDGAAAPLKRLAAHFSGQNRPALGSALSGIRSVSWPAAPAHWAAAKQALAAAAKGLNDHDKTAILREPEYAAPLAVQLKGEANTTQRRITEDAVGQLLAFKDDSAGGFFETYPVALEAQAFFKTHAGVLAASLSTAGADKIKAFMTSYKEAAESPELTSILGDRFVAVVLKEIGVTGQRDSLESLVAIAKAKEIGLNPTAVKELQVAFVEVTSKILLRHGQIDFPASIDVDLPVKYERMDLEEVMGRSRNEAPRFVIVFDVALAKASRRVLDLKEMPSILFLGFESNNKSLNRSALPNDESADTMEEDIENDEQAVSPALETLGSLRNKAVGEPVYVTYNYSKAAIQARKTMTVNYYVIDRQQGTYFQSIFDISQEERFKVAYNIHRRDPKKHILRKEYDSEKDVDDFEKLPVAINLSQLVRHYAANRGQVKQLASLDALRDKIFAAKNKVLANYEAKRYDARPLNDPRFDNVVVIYTGKRGLGSGFFVTSDVVLTNWHVVKNFKIVEMKMYNGRETYGKILGKDVRLDMALIRVQSRGKPVRFYTGRNLDPGMTVEAIGHPMRHEFSVTQGVVSAIRKEYSINLPKWAGDKVLYVQTDAPINGGNSGGPLFLDDKVVGMNTWGWTHSDGLNFSLHYSEILKFLNEHLPGFQVSSKEVER